MAKRSSLLKRGWHTLRLRGWQALFREIDFRLRLTTHRESWRHWADIPLRRELRAQRQAKFPFMPLLSVVAPLYNTSEKYARQMIDSVRRQSYGFWELLLVDASDGAHPGPGVLARRLAESDKRIRYIRMAKNEGIAGNTNAGLRRCVGDYIILLDHDDVLSPAALYEVARAVNESRAELIYSDEVVLDESLKRLFAFHFKPDYGPDTLRGGNYITHLCVFSHRLLESVGGEERPAFDGAQDYDLILRLSEKAERVAHIPKVLYAWRRHGGSTAAGMEQKPAAIEAGARALAQHLERANLEGTVEPLDAHPGGYQIHYKVWGKPLVSVLIPTSDQAGDLRRCLDALYERAGADIEVLFLDYGSSDPATEAFYLEAEENHPGLQVLRYRGCYNFSALCNFGAKWAKGEHLLLLDACVEIISDGFVAEMLAYSQRPSVGAVGALLWAPDDTVWSAGLFVGIGGTVGTSHKGAPKGSGGDMYRLATAQNLSAVSGAALMVGRALYEQLGGLDEHRFPIHYGDADFCLRLREQGLWNVFTPFAEGYLHSAGDSDDSGQARLRRSGEAAAFRDRHGALIKRGDPFYNPHLTLKNETYGLR